MKETFTPYKDTAFNLSHAKQCNSFNEQIETLKKKIILRGDLLHVTRQQQLEIIDQLCAFPLGRFILERRGANGFWTDYMVTHPFKGKTSGLNSEGIPFSPLENWFLNECPIIIAHQERFQIFQRLAQKLIHNNVVIASIPCGIMRDMITLDFSHISNFELIGVDIDPESLALAQELGNHIGIQNIKLLQKNAWELPFHEEIDIITSSGLNVYEPNPQKVLELYTQFYKALKPGGHLIISVLTYPPGDTRETDWDIKNISKESLLLDQILHKDILDIKWRNFRSIWELENEFKQAGFSDISIHFDRLKIFPTILAKKTDLN